MIATAPPSLSWASSEARPLPFTRRYYCARIAALSLFLALAAPTLYAQGCSQCRESIGQTPARTQSAYRRAITVMVIAGAGVFTAALVVLKRFR